MTGAQWLLEEGRQEGRREGRQEGAVDAARRILLRVGSRRFGPPDERAENRLNGIVSVERLEELVEKLNDVADWNALLPS